MKGTWQEWEKNEARIKGRDQKPVPLVEEYNKWKNEGNTGEFIYEINP